MIRISAAALIALSASSVALAQLPAPNGPNPNSIPPGDEKAKPPGPPPIVQNPTAIEPGVYACFSAGADGKRQASSYAVNVQDASNYLLYTGGGQQKEPGTYGFDKGAVTWKSGPMVGKPPGKYEGDAHMEPNQMRLTVFPAGTELSCYMSDAPA